MQLLSSRGSVKRKKRIEAETSQTVVLLFGLCYSLIIVWVVLHLLISLKIDVYAFVALASVSSGPIHSDFTSSVLACLLAG